MELVPLIVILVLVLSLLIQAINFAAAGYGKKGYEYYDSFMTYTNKASLLEQNLGYIVFIVIGAAFSSLIYIYLIISKVASLNLSETLDWWCHVVVVHFQFAIAVVQAVDLKNTQVTYNYQEASMAGVTSQPSVTIWNYFKNTHGLLIAASVLTFIIGFCGGLFVLARKTMELKNFLSTPVNTESKDQNSLGTIK